MQELNNGPTLPLLTRVAFDDGTIYVHKRTWRMGTDPNSIAEALELKLCMTSVLCVLLTDFWRRKQMIRIFLQCAPTVVTS